jgi:hypothetical protein
MFRTPRRFGIIPNPNIIESDEGFSVRVLGQTGLRYTQGDKTLRVNSEVLATRNPSLAISPSSIQHWDPPHDGELIDEATRNLIVDNIRRAFASRGEDIIVGY